jgi:hypothetical protein
MNFGSLNCFLLFKIIRKDFKRNLHSAWPNPAQGRGPIGCGGLLWQPTITASWPDWRGPAGRPAGRPVVGELVGIAHAGKGEGVGQGGTGGDALRWRCDEGLVESVWDGGVPVGGGGFGNLWGPQ